MYRQPSDVLSGVVGICWLIFVAYWLISAFGVKQNVPGKGGFGRWARARIVMVAVVYLLVKLRLLTPLWRFAYELPFFHNEGVRLAGAIFTILGVAIAIWARVYLGRNWSGQPSMKVGHELVTSGPYAFVRNPIYTGLSLALLGTGMALGPLWMVVFVLALVMFLWRIQVEARYMMELFPETFPEYRKRTKALIPGVW